MIVIRSIPAAFGLLLMIAATPALAQNPVVVSSGAPALEPGQMVEAGAPLEVPAGASALAWPKEVGLADGARYPVRLKGSRASRKITLSLVPGDLPTDAHKAAWMAEKGCGKQARRLLARLR